MIVEALNHYRGKRIVVAMSGGVDSSLAAALLHRAGTEVIGVHMRVWHYRDCDADDLNGKIGTCCTPADADDARRVADRFGFPFYAVDFEADFRRAVIDPFIADYLAGRTPNPCVNCNSKMKLGTLLAKARAFGAIGVATGHYARVVHRERGRCELLRAADPKKDQSYYLFGLRQEQLKCLHMPLGEFDKSAVRAMARELGLHLADKPDSQEICFVTDNDYRRFLRDEAGLEEAELAGAIVSAEGRVLGRHEGIHRFTIGQRRGLGVSAERPLYVLDLIPETRTVIVGEAERLLARGLIASGWNWIGREPTDRPIPVRAQIRHHHRASPATLIALESGRARIEFETPQPAVTPGQAVVCYDAETDRSALGGGWIAERSDREIENKKIGAPD